MSASSSDTGASSDRGESRNIGARPRPRQRATQAAACDLGSARPRQRATQAATRDPSSAQPKQRATQIARPGQDLI